MAHRAPARRLEVARHFVRERTTASAGTIARHGVKARTAGRRLRAIPSAAIRLRRVALAPTAVSKAAVVREAAAVTAGARVLRGRAGLQVGQIRTVVRGPGPGEGVRPAATPASARDRRTHGERRGL
ncbi:MAG TPA: hypothetical protein VFY10_02370 [Dehalococcoidia bacterium]|nr:hypothetical protein [Dehalococcoidia bacterium]